MVEKLAAISLHEWHFRVSVESIIKRIIPNGAVKNITYAA